MANFEGEKRLNKETSELEVKGKFKLTKDELDNVVGGSDMKNLDKVNGDLVRKMLEIIFAPLPDESAGTGGAQ